jgi:prepilin-type N-terminal cleavage/methylation domain-containing protein
MKKLLNQSGDTLVEVVMAMAILSVVLVSAYNVSNLSYRLGTQARERTEAAHLMQEQAERLTLYRNTFVKNNPSIPVSGPNMLTTVGGVFPAIGVDYIFDNDLNRVPCVASGPPCDVGRYHVAVRATSGVGVGSVKMTSNITVTWQSAVTDELNTSKIENFVLVDTRGIKLRNCDVATAPGCTD